MKFAPDFSVRRHVPLLERPRLAADLGDGHIEWSPRAGLDWWVRPRA